MRVRSAVRIGPLTEAGQPLRGRKIEPIGVTGIAADAQWTFRVSPTDGSVRNKEPRLLSQFSTETVDNFVENEPRTQSIADTSPLSFRLVVF